MFLGAAWGLHHSGFDTPMVYDSKGLIQDKADVYSRNNPIEIISTQQIRPLTMLSFQLSHMISGMNPYSFRVFNAAVLAATGVALVVLVHLLLAVGSRPEGPQRALCTWISLFAGAWFVFHPIQAFVVLYIWQRSAIMACFFYFTGFAVYLAGRTGRVGSVPAYVVTSLLMLCGLLSKELLLAFPLTLLAAEVVLFQAGWRQLIRAVGVVVVISILPVVSYVLSVNLLHGPESPIVKGALRRLISYYQLGGLSPIEVLLTQARMLFAYLEMIVAPWPDGLELVRCVVVSVSLWAPPSTFLAVSGVFVLVGAAVWLARKRPLFSFGILFFIINMAPESLLIPSYQYFGYRPILPMAGFLLLLADTVLWVLGAAEGCGVQMRQDRETSHTPSISPAEPQAFHGLGLSSDEGPPADADYAPTRMGCSMPTVLAASKVVPLSMACAAVVVLIWFGSISVSNARVWCPLALWHEAYLELPLLSGRLERKPYWDIVVNYTCELTALGDYLKVLEVLNKSIARAPETSEAGSGSKLQGAGKRQLQQDRLITNLAKQPSVPASAYLNRAWARKRAGDLQGAMQDYNKAIEVEPDSAEAYNNLGLALEESGQLAQARTQYQAAIRSNPKMAVAFFNLGNLDMKEEHLDEAIMNLEKATALQPARFGVANANKGYVLMKMGRPSEAVTAFRQAVTAGRSDAELHNAMGAALAHLGRAEEAMVEFRQALALNPNDPIALENVRMLEAEVRRKAPDHRDVGTSGPR